MNYWIYVKKYYDRWSQLIKGGTRSDTRGALDWNFKWTWGPIGKCQRKKKGILLNLVKFLSVSITFFYRFSKLRFRNYSKSLCALKRTRRLVYISYNNQSYTILTVKNHSLMSITYIFNIKLLSKIWNFSFIMQQTYIGGSFPIPRPSSYLHYTNLEL